jgi:hypothetical protein
MIEFEKPVSKPTMKYCGGVPILVCCFLNNIFELAEENLINFNW